MLQYITYKPNAKVSGALFNLHLSEKRDCVYLSSLLQASWNDETKKGSFSANREDKDKNLSCKFNLDELGGMLHALNTMGTWEQFHNFNDNKTKFKLAVWDRSSMNKPNAMGFSVIRNGAAKFSMSYEPGEIECLKIFLTEAIKEIMWNKNQKQEEQ